MIGLKSFTNKSSRIKAWEVRLDVQFQVQKTYFVDMHVYTAYIDISTEKGRLNSRYTRSKLYWCDSINYTCNNKYMYLHANNTSSTSLTYDVHT